MLTRGFGGPLRYVQGPGVLAELGPMVKGLGDSALILTDAFIDKAHGTGLMAGLAAGVATTRAVFGGESTDDEVARLTALAPAARVVIGVGGGKTLDTAKITARNIGARIVTVPTIASTDSPTSSIGVIYTPEGAHDRLERCYRNPDVVLVDTAVVLQAPVRFLAARMSNTLSTWFEARLKAESRSRNNIADGYAPTAAGTAVARACHDVLMRDGRAAYIAAQAGCLTEAVENIIEANTLLSGLGFENCGVSAAHGVHDALTILEPTHHFFHGEKVAFGILCLLVLENRPLAELHEAARFCRDIDLPTRLEDLGLGAVTTAELMAVGEEAMKPSNVIHSTPRSLTARGVADAIRTADRLASSL